MSSIKCAGCGAAPARGLEFCSDACRLFVEAEASPEDTAAAIATRIRIGKVYEAHRATSQA